MTGEADGGDAMITRRAALAILIGIALAAGCGPSTGVVERPSVAAPPSVASAPSTAPSSAPASASWVRPKAKAIVKTMKVELAAKAAEAASVAFTVEARDGSR